MRSMLTQSPRVYAPLSHGRTKWCAVRPPSNHLSLYTSVYRTKWCSVRIGHEATETIRCNFDPVQGLILGEGVQVLMPAYVAHTMSTVNYEAVKLSCVCMQPFESAHSHHIFMCCQMGYRERECVCEREHNSIRYQSTPSRAVIFITCDCK